MDADEFRKRGREMVDYIADYMTQIRSRRVTPEVEPGYLRKLLPPSAPKKGEDWDNIMKDIEGAIMPGITHWQHPNFHAYFPAGNSFPSILGDMLSDAIGCIGFSWAASPACTELETLVLDWMGKMIGLPKQFLHSSGEGGGVIQGSASESVLVALLSARHRAIKQVKERQPYIEEGQLLSRLVGYCSKLSHSCVEKAGMIGCVKMRHLDVDENFSLRGHVLEDAIEEDKKLGLIPFFVCATLGTTACCSFDNLAEIGEVATRHGIYLHVDAAYAGNALICPEFHYIKEGVENVDSFSFNTNKWLQVNFDCSLMWVRSVDDLTTALTVDPLYLQHKHGDKAIDLRHWGIPLSRRFRALKLWFVIRTYGIEGLQQRIREHCRLAKLFEAEVLSDDRFEVLGDVTMGLVCFRLQGPNSRTQKLLKMINDSGKLHMVPAMLNEHYIIRFALCTEYACDEDITYAWKVVTSAASELLQGRKRCDSNKENGTLYDLSDYIGDEDTFAAFDEEIIFDNQREHLQKSQVMRNCFFKMVSDPKCYNPRVLRSLSRQVATQRDERLDRRNVEKLRAEDKENSMPKSELQVNFVKDKSQKDTAVAGPREGSRRKSVQFKKNSFSSSESKSSFEDDEINSVENIPPQAKGEKTADPRNKIKIMTNSNNSQQGTSLRSTVVDYKTSSREELQKKGQDDGTERRRKIADDSEVKEKQQKMTSSNKEINYKFADNINESDDDAELARRKTNFSVQTQTKPPIAKRMRQNGITEKGLRATEKCDGKPAMTTSNDDGHIGMDMKSMIALEKTVCRSDEATETSFDSPDPDGLDEGIVLEDRAVDRDGTSHWGQSQENEEDETGKEDIITMA